MYVHTYTHTYTHTYIYSEIAHRTQGYCWDIFRGKTVFDVRAQN